MAPFLIQRGLDSIFNSGKGSGVKIRSFLVVRWDRTGARAPWPQHREEFANG
jgi:hypothetical protein